MPRSRTVPCASAPALRPALTPCGTYIRAGIVRQAGVMLASAATIAVRYCSIRRQFVDRDAPASDEQKPAETQVIKCAMQSINFGRC